MAAYEDLATLIPSFKRAAIDAYMRTLPYAWTIVGDHYEINSSSAHYKVTRPGEDGEGGGDWSSDNFIANLFTDGSNDEKYTESFENIRSRIDAAVARFLHLPDPDEIEVEVEKCRQVTRGLSGAAAASEGGQVGSGIIPGNLALIMENSSAMSGASISAFKSRFVAQLGPAIGGLHGISIITGCVLASEKGIWEAARQNVADLVENGRDAAQALADSGTTPDLKTILKVAGWAVKGVGLFLPAGKPVLEVVGLGITVLEGTAGAAQTATISGSDAVAVLTSFEESLEKLADEITAEERLLEANLTQNLANIRNDRSSYDLSTPVIVNDHDGDVIAYTPGLINEITQTYMPTVATELASLASVAFSTSLNPLTRVSDLGIGSRGPSAGWYDLRFLLWELLKDLAWEVERGAENLDLVLRDLEGVEETASQDLQLVIAELREGSPHDPWD